MKVKLFILACAALLVSGQAFAADHVRGQLKVGVAKIDVTPGPDQLGRNSYGVLDHTHFRVILFSNGNNIAGSPTLTAIPTSAASTRSTHASRRISASPRGT